MSPVRRKRTPYIQSVLCLSNDFPCTFKGALVCLIVSFQFEGTPCTLKDFIVLCRFRVYYRRHLADVACAEEAHAVDHDVVRLVLAGDLRGGAQHLRCRGFLTIHNIDKYLHDLERYPIYNNYTHLYDSMPLYIYIYIYICIDLRGGARCVRRARRLRPLQL